MMVGMDITGDKLHVDTKVKLQLKQETSFQRTQLVQFWTGNHDLYGSAAKRGYKIVNSYFKYTYLNFSHDRITPGLNMISNLSFGKSIYVQSNTRSGLPCRDKTRLWV